MERTPLQCLERYIPYSLALLPAYIARPWTARLSPRALAYYAYILSLDDRAILERCSTTPQDEAPDFAEGIRSTFSFLLSKSNAEGPMDDEEGIELAGSRVIDVPETVWGWRDGKWAAEEVD